MTATFSLCVGGQTRGAAEISGRVKLGGKLEKITRKRFYMLRGGFEQNRGLIDKLKTADFVSRDCFYCKMKASPEYIAWLKAYDCESPYCREISTEDAAKVPEFSAAYQRGLKKYRGKTNIAQGWLTSELAPELRDGFYQERKESLAKLLGGTKPIQSSMTDSVSVKAVFIDIPLAKPDGEETFLISNLLPIEVGSKSYIWACEVGIERDKTAKLVLPGSDTSKLIKHCEVIVRDLPKCDAGVCSEK